MKETLKAIWRITPIYIKIIYIPILLAYSFIFLALTFVSGGTTFIYLILPLIIIYFLFESLNIKNSLEKVSRKIIHTNCLLHFVIFIVGSLIWLSIALPKVHSEYGVEKPLAGILIVYVVLMASIIFLLTINIIIKVIKNKKYKKDFLKKYKIHLRILMILFFILIIGLISFFVYKEINKIQRADDTELTKRAVEENNPKLCEEAHDTPYCYYRYARVKRDKSLCTREIMTDKWLIPCNSMIGRGYNYTI